METFIVAGINNVQVGDVVEFDYMITNGQFPYRVNVKGEFIDGFYTTHNGLFIELRMTHYDGATMRNCNRIFAEDFIIHDSFKKE